MPRHHLRVSTSKGAVIAGFASLLVGAPVDCAYAQVVPQELGNALQNLFKGATPGDQPQAPPVPLPRSSLPARGSPVQGPDFVLLGVVIAGDTRMALIQDSAVNPGGPRFLQLGESLGGRRLTDVQPDRVTLEGRGGEQVIVRLGTGMGVAASASALASGPGPSTPRPTVRPASPSVVDENATPPSTPGLGQPERPESVRAVTNTGEPRPDQATPDQAKLDQAKLDRDAKKRDKDAREADKKAQRKARAAARGTAPR